MNLLSTSRLWRYPFVRVCFLWKPGPCTTKVYEHGRWLLVWGPPKARTAVFWKCVVACCMYWLFVFIWCVTVSWVCEGRCAQGQQSSRRSTDMRHHILLCFRPTCTQGCEYTLGSWGGGQKQSQMKWWECLAQTQHISAVYCPSSQLIPQLQNWV